MCIICFLFSIEETYSQNYDLQIIASEIVTPTNGAEFCNNDNPPLRFKVDNLDSSPDSSLYTDIDINAHSLLATLTLTGANTGVVTRSFNSKGSGSQNPGSTTIATTTYAYFDWPENLSIQNIGTTTITIEIGLLDGFGNEQDSTNNSASIQVSTTLIPSISLISDKESNAVCSTDSGDMLFTVTSTPTAIYYVFYKNEVQVVSSTSTTYSSTIGTLTNGTIIKVQGFNSSGCYAEDTVTVNINDSTPGSIGGDQTICVGDTPTVLTNEDSATVSGSIAILGQYKWQSSLDGSTGWSDVSGATSSTFQPPASPPASIFYRRLVINNNAGLNCEEASNSIQLTVNSLPTAGITAVGLATASSTLASASICGETTVNFNASGGVQYEFFIDNISIQARGSSSNFSTNTLDDTDEVKVIAYDSATATACFDESAVIKFNVTQYPIASISSDVNSNTYCSGENVTFTAGGGGSSLFTFFKNGVEVRGSDPAPTYSINSLSGSEIITVQASLNGCSSLASLTMVENAITTVGSITTASTTICSGETPLIIIGDTGVVGGALSYQWQTSLDGATWNNINTSTGVLRDYTPDNPLMQTTTFRRKTISTVGTLTCEAISDVQQILVTTSPDAVLKAYPGLPPTGEVIAPGTLAICSGETAYFYGSGTGATQYEFLIGGVTARARSSVTTYTNNGLVGGDLISLITYNAGNCSTQSSTITIALTTPPTVDFASNLTDNITFCSGTAITFTATSTGATNYKFTIQGATQQDSASNTFIALAGTVSNTSVVGVIATGASGCTASSTFTMVENKITTIGTISTVSPTICPGEVPASLTGTAGGVSVGGTLSYLWQSKTDSTTWQNITVSGTLQAYTPTAPITQKIYYKRKTISTRGAIVCEEESNVIVVSMETLPTAILKAYPGLPPTGEVIAPGTLAICSGETAYFYGSGTGATQYEFLIGGVTAQARSSVTTYTNSVLNTGEQVTVKTYNAAGCFIQSQAITIVATTPPTVDFASNLTDNITFCSGTAITFTATSTGATNYKFTIQGATQQDSASNTFIALAGTVSNTSVVGVIATGASGCTASSTFTMVENKITTIGTISTVSPTICPGEVPASLTGTAGGVSVGGTLSYLWQSKTDSTTWQNITVSGTLQAYTPTAPITQKIYYKRKTISTRGAIVCEEESNVVVVSMETLPTAILKGYPGVPPAGEITATGTLTICSGETAYFYGSGTGATQYEFLIGGVTAQARSSVTTYTNSVLNTGEQVTVKTYNAAGCFIQSQAITIVATTPPTVDFASNLTDNITFCSGTAITFTATSTGATNYKFTIQGATQQDSASNTFIALAGTVSNTSVVGVIATGASGCTASSTFTMVENKITTIGTISTVSPTICPGEVPASLTGTAGGVSVGGTLSYLWQSKTDSTTWQNITVSGTLQAYTPTAPITQKIYYKRKTISTRGAIVCEEESNVIVVSMETLPTAILKGYPGVPPAGEITATGTLTICSGETAYFYGSGTGATQYEFLIGGVTAQARSSVTTYTNSVLNTGEQVTVKTYNAAGCFIQSQAITIVATTPPTVDFASNLTDNITFCSGTAITFTATSTGATNYKFTIQGATQQDSASNTFIALAGTVSNTSVVGVIATGASGCTASSTFTMVENKITTIGTISTVSPTICPGEVPASLTGTAGGVSVGGTLSYLWQSKTDSTTWQNITVSGTLQAYTPTAPITQKIYYKRKTISTRGAIVCEEESNVIVVSMETLPTAILKGYPGVPPAGEITATGTLTICSGETAYFYGSGTGATQYEFLIGGVTAQARSSVTTYTNSVLNTGEQVTVKTYNAAGCFIQSQAITIVATTPPTVDFASNLTDNITFCSGTAITFTATSTGATNYKFTIQGATQQDSASNTFIALAGTVSNTSVVGVIATGASGCTASSTFTMVENKITTIGTISTVSPTICSGEVPASLTGTAGGVSVGGTLSYLWQFSLDGVIWNNISIASTSTTYTPTAPVTQNTYYKRKTISKRGVIACEEDSNVLLVAISGGPIANLIAYPGAISGSNTLTICSGASVDFEGSGAGIGGTYEFLIGGLPVRARSSIATYTTTSLITGNQVTVRAYNAAGCPRVSDPIYVVAETIPIVNLYSDLADNITFCDPTAGGGAVTFTGQSNLVGTTFQFFVNGVSKQGPSATSTYSISSLNDSDTVSVTFTTPGGCSVYSALTMVKNTVTIAGTISPTTKMTICEGDTPVPLTETVSSTVAGARSYEWFTSTDTLNWESIISTNIESYPPGSLTETTFFKRKAISTLNGQQCFRYSNVVEVFVAAPISGLGGTITPGNEVICTGIKPTNMIVTGGAVGPLITYQWQDSSDGVAFTNITGETGQNYILAPADVINSTTYYKRLVFAAGSAACVESSDIHKVTVNDINPGSIDPSLAGNYCYGNSPPTLVSSPTAGGGGQEDPTSAAPGVLTYQWKQSPDNGTWTNIGGATNLVYNPPALIATTYYRRHVISILFDASSSTTSTCEAFTPSIKFEILPELNNGAVLTDQTICSDDTPAALTLNGASPISATTSYQWQKSNDNISWSNIAGQTAAALPGASAGATAPETYYRVVISYIGAPVPKLSEKASINLIDRVPAVAQTNGVTYTISINNSTYTYTTSAASGTNVDSIGQGLTDLIGATDGTVNVSYDTSANIISLTQKVTGTYNLAASTGTPPSIAVWGNSTNSILKMKVLVSGTGPAAAPVSSAATCQTYSDVAIITVTPEHTLVQNVGPLATQTICNGLPIDQINFQWGGAAEFIIIEGLDPDLVVATVGTGTVTAIPGLASASYKVEGAQIKITGTPDMPDWAPANTFSIVTSSTLDNCTVKNLTYTILEERQVRLPSYVYKKINNRENVVVQNGGKWYNNTICQDNLSSAVTETFFVCYGSWEPASLNFEWWFEPAGVMTADPTVSADTRSAIYSLSPSFTGSLTIKVRANTCTGVLSDYLETHIDVVPQTTPLSAATPLAAPEALYIWDGCLYIGPEPDCELTQDWLDNNGTTQYFSSTTGTDTNNYASVEFRIDNILPSASSSVATPGLINTNSGVMTWNVGFSGTFYVQSRAISCAGTPTVWNAGRQVVITESDSPIQSITITDEPLCVVPAAGRSSIFTATRMPSSLEIDWFIDNPNALIGASYVDSPTTDSDGHYVLNDNADETLTVQWKPGFFGIATIFAETFDPASDCPADKYSRVVYVPQVQVLDLTSGGGSNLAQVCQGSTLSSITYQVKGAISYTLSPTSPFPQGINSTIEAKAQVSTYTLTVTGAAFTAGKVYQLRINGVVSKYTTLAGASLDIIGQGIADAINANLQLDPLNLSASSPEVQAQYLLASDQLVLTTISNFGYKFESSISYPITPAVSFGLPVKEEAINTLTIFGTVTDLATPTTYVYDLITTATSGCATELVSGSITVQPKSTFTFITGTNSITLCDYSNFDANLATIEIGNATGANIVGLPLGLSTSISGAPPRIIISGKVDLGVSVPTVFSVDITSTGNAGGCSPETTQRINIIVNPVPVITPVNPLVTDQTLCVSGTFINIDYEINNINYGLTTDVGSQFPPGIIGELISRKQISEFQIGGADPTGAADLFIFNIESSTPFSTTITATAGINRDTLGAELVVALNAISSPTYLFEYSAATDKMKITGPTGAPFFTMLSETSATVTVTSVTVLTTPGVYTISGTPSNATTETTSYIYILTTNGIECAGATSVSGTIIINPKVGGAHDAGSGNQNQTICDNTLITPITYSISDGATGISGTWPSWLSVLLSDDKSTVTISTIDALKNIDIDYTNSYTYVVGFAGGGVCGPGGESLTGVITVNPKQKIAIKDAATAQQSVCEGDLMIPIEYDFYGSAASASFTPTLNLPDGVTGEYTPRKQIMKVYLTGPVTGTASQTYTVYINGLAYSFTSSAVSKTLVSIGNELSLTVNSSPDVEASFSATPSNTITISALVSGTGFSAFIPANTNDISLSQPSLASSAGVFNISGSPTSIATTTAYNYILITNGLLCTPASVTGTITVNPNSELTIDAGSNNNQIRCDETAVSTISYSLGGGALNYTITGLPNSMQHRLNNAGAVSKVEIYGTPVTGDISTRIYAYTITTDSNVNGCDQVSATGTITIQPIEKLEISNPSGASNQTVCQGLALDPIIYEIYGGASNVNPSGLPVGITGVLTPTIQSTTLPFAGTNTTGIATETFIVYLNGNEIKYETGAIKTPAQIAGEFQTLLNARAEVSASIVGSVITVTGVSTGTGFTLSSYTGTPITVTIGNPLTSQGTGKFALYGTPGPASVATGTQETYIYTLSTSGAICSPTTVTGTIIVTPKSTISIVATPTQNQTVCDDQNITNINFNYSGSAQGAEISWSPSVPTGIGFSFLNAAKTATISGKPDNLNVLVPTVYTYTVSTTGNLSSCSEASFSGQITVNPNDTIIYDATSGSRNQTACSGSPIVPIKYQLGGGATGATVLGLLPGLVYTVNASNVLTISGTVTDSNVLISNRSFTISTIGLCSPDLSEVSGDFTIYPVSELSLASAVGSNIQLDGLCNDGIEDITTPIQYTWGGGAQTVTITWSPFDPQFDQQSFGVPTKSFVIAGSTSANVSVTTIFSYVITTVNENACTPEVTLNGQIEVNPKPVINVAAIQALIVNETCFGSSDGNIILPSTASSTFANFVTGGQTALKQRDQITFTGTTTIGDSFQLTLGSKSFTELVTATPTFSQIITDLVFKINNSPAPNDSPVVASLIGANILQLEAEVAGTPFTPIFNITSTDTVTDTKVTTQPNRITNYSISWTKEGTDEAVTPSALASGTYDLKVTLNGCESNTSSFTIIGATELKINDLSLCGGSTTGSIQGSVSGGDGVYNIYLYDENGALVAIHPDTGTATFTFSNLPITGKTYRILFKDNTCIDAAKWAERDNITLTTEITYDPLIVENTQSYCATGTAGNGSIETAKIVGGLPVYAFSGGSGNFSYQWKNDSNINIGVSPNINNLIPAVYELTVTDIDLGCTKTVNYTVGGYDSLALQVNLLGPLVPVLNLTTSSTADYVITLVCNTGFDNAVIDVTASGGASSYAFSWKKNGAPLAGGIASIPPNSSASNLGVGLYEVTVTDSGPNGLFCVISKTVEVLAPTAPDVTYIISESQMPKCFGDTAKLVFQVTGGNFAEIYQIKLDGANYASNWSTTSRTITIEALPEALPALITQISIYDSNDCSTTEKTLLTPITIPVIDEIEIVSSSTDSDCESGVSGTITFEKAGTAFTAAEQLITQIKLELQGVAAQTIYKTWSELSGGNGSLAIISSLPTHGTYNYQITSSTGTNVCAPITGSVEIIDSTYKLNFESPIVTNIGCSGEDKGKIVIPNITGVLAPLKINWEQKELITTIDSTPRGDDSDGDGFIDIDENLQSTNPNDPTSTPTPTLDADGDGLTDSYEKAISQTNPNLADTDNDGVNDKLDGYPLNSLIQDLLVTSQQWSAISRLDGFNTASDLEEGTYRAKVSDARSTNNPDCGGVKVTKELVIYKQSFSVLNFKIEEQNVAADCADPANAKSDITFTIQNGSGSNDYQVLIDGLPATNYTKPPSASNTHRVRSLVPGDYTLTVSSTFDGNECKEEVPFTILQNEQITYSGDVEFETDSCTGNLSELKAQATGGVPFIVNGIATYQYT